MTDLCKQMELFGKGIGSEPRYALVQTLLKGSKSVSELVSIVGMSQPLVSQHLKTLKETGLVSDERIGKSIKYSLNAEHMLKLLTALSKDVERCKKKS